MSSVFRSHVPTCCLWGLLSWAKLAITLLKMKTFRSNRIAENGEGGDDSGVGTRDEGDKSPQLKVAESLRLLGFCESTWVAPRGSHLQRLSKGSVLRLE